MDDKLKPFEHMWTTQKDNFRLVRDYIRENENPIFDIVSLRYVIIEDSHLTNVIKEKMQSAGVEFIKDYEIDNLIWNHQEKSEAYSVAQSFLRGYFALDDYQWAVNELLANLNKSTLTRQSWEIVKANIENRVFRESEPLHLVWDGANQVLDENTDAEAYKWLDLFIENVEREDGSITEY